MTTSTTNTTVPTPDQPYVLQRDEGRHLHFLNNLATIKATPGETGTMSVVEFSAPHGFGPPLHVHHDEDELVVVLDGEVRFTSGENSTDASAGGLAWLPHAVPHSFQVLSDSARMLSITTRSDAAAPKFDRFVTTLGEPTDEVAIPAPTDVDPGQVAMVSEQHNIGVLGPPPAPLV